MEDDHDVHIISFGAAKQEMEGITVHHVPTRKELMIPFIFYWEVRQIRKIINEIAPDIVHAHYISKYGILAAYVAFHPYILPAWGNDVSFEIKGGFRGTVHFLTRSLTWNTLTMFVFPSIFLVPDAKTMSLSFEINP